MLQQRQGLSAGLASPPDLCAVFPCSVLPLFLPNIHNATQRRQSTVQMGKGEHRAAAAALTAECHALAATLADLDSAEELRKRHRDTFADSICEPVECAVIAALTPACTLDAAQRSCEAAHARARARAERPSAPVRRPAKSADAHIADGKAHFAAGRWHEATGSWLAAVDEAGCCAKAGRPAHKETEASAGLAFVSQLLLSCARASQRRADDPVLPPGHLRVCVAYNFGALPLQL